jgi:sugar diacid utilization regulator
MRPPELILVAPVEADDAHNAWFARFKNRLNDLLARVDQWRVQEELRIGVGRLAASPQILASRYQEAHQALMIGRSLFAEQPITYFGELGIYRLLFHLRAYEDVRAFYQEVALLYRLERIQEVLHVDLEDADARLSLQVALKMRHTLAP